MLNRIAISRRRMSYKSLYAVFLFVSIVSCKQQHTASTSEKPEDNRFTTAILTTPGAFDEPMEMSFAGRNRILIAERKGTLKSVDLTTNSVRVIASLPVNTKYTSKDGKVSEAEEGLMGVAVHPAFESNHWIYLYYADTADAKHVLARYELHEDSLYLSSRKIVLEVPLSARFVAILVAEWSLTMKEICFLP